MPLDHKRFWQTKSLDEMSESEWEQLCDRCGLCCLVRVEDEDSGQIYDTNVICRHYSCDSRQCTSYPNRNSVDGGCVKLTPELVRQYEWLPDSCAYRTVLRGDDLPATHPLVAGDSSQVRTVVDIFEPFGLAEYDPQVAVENHLIAREDLGY